MLSEKVSVLISFFQDLDFLEEVVDRVAWADEIVILDGPFRFALPTLSLFQDEGLQEPAGQTQRAIARLGQRHGDKIVYSFSVYEEEGEKRRTGYEKCRYPIVLLVDADELLDVDLEELQRFIDSDRGAGYFLCLNISLNGFATAKKKHLDTNTSGGYPWGGKFFAFKKNKITAARHVDYLWLVGVQQQAKDRTLIYRTSLAYGYHLTGLRGTQGQVTKFAFYHSLSRSLSGKSPQEDSLLSKYVSEEILSKREAGEIFARSSKPCLGLPPGSALLPAELPAETLNPIYYELIERYARPFTKVYTAQVIPRVGCIMLVDRTAQKLSYSVTHPCNYLVRIELLRLYHPVATEMHSVRGYYDPDRSSDFTIDLQAVDPSLAAHARTESDLGLLVELTIWLRRDAADLPMQTGQLPRFEMRALDADS